jgi:hypothetical protein
MKEIFRQAAEIAQHVPESMQAAAFNRALDMLTERAGGRNLEVDRVTRGSGEQQNKPPVERPESTFSVDRCLVQWIRRSTLVWRHRQGAGTLADGSANCSPRSSSRRLTPPEIARILTEKFRLGTSAAAVNMALGPASTLVNRVPRGRAYEYRIMGPGEAYVANLGPTLAA